MLPKPKASPQLAVVLLKKLSQVLYLSSGGEVSYKVTVKAYRPPSDLGKAGTGIKGKNSRVTGTGCQIRIQWQQEG